MRLFRVLSNGVVNPECPPDHEISQVLALLKVLALVKVTILIRSHPRQSSRPRRRRSHSPQGFHLPSRLEEANAYRWAESGLNVSYKRYLRLLV